MKLIKLHFVYFCDDDRDTFNGRTHILYEPVYIRADKINVICPNYYSSSRVMPNIPIINKNIIPKDDNSFEVRIDDCKCFRKITSQVFFEPKYTKELNDCLIYSDLNPFKITQSDEDLCFLIYENPEEIIGLINGEDVPLEIFDPLDGMVIDDLDLSVRTTNILRAEGINTVADLIKYSEVKLLRFPNLGKRSLRDIQDRLAERELWLGMKR